MAYEIKLLKGHPIENSIRGEEVETYIGVFRAGELVNRCQIPHRDFSSNTGYQRMPNNSRVTKLKNALKSRNVDLPTAILLGVRDRSLRPKLEPPGNYILKVPQNSAKPFYVVDGQHRLEALRVVIEEEMDDYWVDYRIPAVIFFGSDEGVEMDQFHTVNSNAKSIPTDLALDLLKLRAKKDDKYWKYLEKTNQSWKVIAQDLTEKVAKRGVWAGKIRFSNERKGDTLITSDSFVASLKTALNQTVFSSYNLDNRARVIDAYWRGIAIALPECFYTPNDFNIQKTTGVNVLHSLLPMVLTYASRFGNPVYEAGSYGEIMGETLQGLSGDNSQGGDSVGTDFWKVGAEGASGTYSSSAGRRVLVKRIEGELEENLRGQLD